MQLFADKMPHTYTHALASIVRSGGNLYCVQQTLFACTLHTDTRPASKKGYQRVIMHMKLRLNLFIHHSEHFQEAKIPKVKKENHGHWTTAKQA